MKLVSDISTKYNVYFRKRDFRKNYTGYTKNNDRISFINRIENLSSKYFHSEISKIDMDIYGKVINREIILTLEEIGQAIADGKQVTFHYCDCGLDGNPIFRVDKHGNIKQYIVNPYQIISKNGHSYLLCCTGRCSLRMQLRSYRLQVYANRLLKSSEML